MRLTWAIEDGRSDDAGTFAAEFENWLATEAEHRRFWLARAGDEAVAMVNLLLFDRMPTAGRPGGRWGYLSNMFVLASHRNIGVGAQLAAAVIGFADRESLERIVLNPSERSVSFYQALGFVRADELLVRTHGDNGGG